MSSARPSGKGWAVINNLCVCVCVCVCACVPMNYMCCTKDQTTQHSMYLLHTLVSGSKFKYTITEQYMCMYSTVCLNALHAQAQTTCTCIVQVSQGSDYMYRPDNMHMYSTCTSVSTLELCTCTVCLKTQTKCTVCLNTQTTSTVCLKMLVHQYSDKYSTLCHNTQTQFLLNSLRKLMPATSSMQT